MTNTKNTKLSSSVTIAIYEILKREKDAYGIANLIYERFYERYLKPFECNKNRHGFSMMAVSFLMIETLHSFQTGLDDTTGNGKNSFNCFFSQSIYLSEFADCSAEFYNNIRCGILHQAETKNGWRIWRRGPLLDSENKTINADKFLKALHNELNRYVNLLKHGSVEYESSKKEPTESILYKNAIKKLNYICKNCGPA